MSRTVMLKGQKQSSEFNDWLERRKRHATTGLPRITSTEFGPKKPQHLVETWEGQKNLGTFLDEQDGLGALDGYLTLQIAAILKVVMMRALLRRSQTISSR